MEILEKLDILKEKLEQIFSSNIKQYSNDTSTQVVDAILDFLDSDIECNLFNLAGVITSGLTVPPFTATGRCYYLGEESFIQTEAVLIQKCFGFFSTSNSFSYGRRNLKLSDRQDLTFYAKIFSEFLYDFFASSKFEGKFLSVNPIPAIPSIKGTLTGLIQTDSLSSGLIQNRSKFISELSSIIDNPEKNVNNTSQNWYNFLNSVKSSIKFEAHVDIDVPSIYDPITLSGTYITSNIIVEATIL